MNKLVSKNPVQRFKQGKQISKAQNGIWDTVKNYGKKVLDYGDTAVYTAAAGIPAGVAHYVGKELAIKPTYRLAKKAFNTVKDWVLQTPDGAYLFGEKSPQQNTRQYNAPTLKKKSVTGPGSTKSPDKLSSSESKVVAGGSSKGNMFINQSKNTTPINNIWLRGFNRYPEITDVRAMQQKLIDLGLLKDQFGADGKWGKNTEAAYQKYLQLQNVPTYEKPEMPSVAEMAGIYTEENKPLYQKIRFKQGGQLVSRNPIKRFKNKKK